MGYPCSWLAAAARRKFPMIYRRGSMAPGRHTWVDSQTLSTNFWTLQVGLSMDPRIQHKRGFAAQRRSICVTLQLSSQISKAWFHLLENYQHQQKSAVPCLVSQICLENIFLVKSNTQKRYLSVRDAILWKAKGSFGHCPFVPLQEQRYPCCTYCKSTFNVKVWKT